MPLLSTRPSLWAECFDRYAQGLTADGTLSDGEVKLSRHPERDEHLQLQALKRRIEWDEHRLASLHRRQRGVLGRAQPHHYATRIAETLIEDGVIKKGDSPRVALLGPSSSRPDAIFARDLLDELAHFTGRPGEALVYDDCRIYFMGAHTLPVMVRILYQNVFPWRRGHWSKLRLGPEGDFQNFTDPPVHVALQFLPLIVGENNDADFWMQMGLSLQNILVDGGIFMTEREYGSAKTSSDEMQRSLSQRQSILRMAGLQRVLGRADKAVVETQTWLELDELTRDRGQKLVSDTLLVQKRWE